MYFGNHAVPFPTHSRFIISVIACQWILSGEGMGEDVRQLVWQASKFFCIDSF